MTKVSKFQVLRTHISPYQSQDFLYHEEKMISQFPELKYETDLSSISTENILITNTHTELSRLPQSVLSKTKLIIHPNSGYDHFAHEHNIWKSIPVVIGHTIRAQAVAEYSLGALFKGLWNYLSTSPGIKTVGGREHFLKELQYGYLDMGILEKLLPTHLLL